MNGYEDELIRLGLLPDRELKQARKIRAWGAAAAVFGVGLAKIIVAESTGHHNIFFLVVLMVVFSIAALAISLSDRTRAGDRMIDDLRTLFGGMKQRSAAIHNGASPKEFALMAAVFGMATVPNGKTLFPKAYTASCGLACGSDSSSGGSSCGGGGGCGGCGGS